MGKTRLYVAQINYQATDKDLHDLFAEYGTVKEAKIINDRNTGKSRGFGFVEMNTPAEAEASLALDGERFMERNIAVSFAKDK